MTVGGFPGKGGHAEGFIEEIGKAAMDEDDFFTWFDTSENKEAAFAKGSDDFQDEILSVALPYLGEPSALSTKVALEIGCGGGRLLAAASPLFDRVLGVDIHGQLDKVKEELQARGCGNVALHRITGDALPVETGQVDFVYSYIVLQHVERISVVQNYVREVARVLRPGGVAVLYFGRYCPWSYGRASAALVALDRWLARYALPGGYKELVARVNCVNLLVGESFARDLALQNGLTPVHAMVSRRPGRPRSAFGGQHGLVMVKAPRA